MNDDDRRDDDDDDDDDDLWMTYEWLRDSMMYEWFVIREWFLNDGDLWMMTTMMISEWWRSCWWWWWWWCMDDVWMMYGWCMDDDDDDAHASSCYFLSLCVYVHVFLLMMFSRSLYAFFSCARVRLDTSAVDRQAPSKVAVAGKKNDFASSNRWDMLVQQEATLIL